MILKVNFNDFVENILSCEKLILIIRGDGFDGFIYLFFEPSIEILTIYFEAFITRGVSKENKIYRDKVSVKTKVRNVGLTTDK